MPPKTTPPDNQPTATATTTTGTDTGAEVGARLGKLENKLDALINSLHSDAGKTTDKRLDASNSVAETVQAELARRDEVSKKAEEAERLGKVELAIGALTEKQPDPIVRRVEKIMGWRNGS